MTFTMTRTSTRAPALAVSVSVLVLLRVTGYALAPWLFQTPTAASFQSADPEASSPPSTQTSSLPLLHTDRPPHKHAFVSLELFHIQMLRIYGDFM